MSRKKFFIIAIPVIGILMALLFIPTNLFFGINSYNEESPSPIMVLENTEDVLLGLKITPISCRETDSGLTESQFQITNNNENDYKVKVSISYTNNEEILFEKEVNLTIFSSQTINQNHLSDAVYDNPVCVVKIINYTKV